eukprot:1308748-Alexandrium_andersonii.AAC.1
MGADASDALVAEWATQPSSTKPASGRRKSKPASSATCASVASGKTATPPSGPKSKGASSVDAVPPKAALGAGWPSEEKAKEGSPSLL